MHTPVYSKGCELCQNGKWLCIFLTYQCNGGCSFCPAPFKDDRIYSDLGNNKEQILRYLKITDIKGISFSGGDPFMVFERFLEWLHFFKGHFPNNYFWVYTNGLLADEKKLMLLAKTGINEIRFNIANHYANKEVLANIRRAMQIIDHVAVEIPSIPSDFNEIIRIMPELNDMGIHYLNLHQFIFTPNDNKSSKIDSAVFLLNNEIKIEYDQKSLSNTENIIQYCSENGMNIQINSCDLVRKENQMTQRRVQMSRLYKESFESLAEDGFLITIMNYPNKLSKEEINRHFSSNQRYTALKKYFIHPDEYRSMHRYSNGCVAKIILEPPMSIYDKKTIYRIELLQ